MISSLTAVLIAVFAADSCPLPDPRAGTVLDFSSMKGYVVTEGDARLVRFAPIFLVEAYDTSYNRIGTPSARYDAKKREVIYIDTARPTFYTQVLEWESETAKYTNLIYRVHFEMSKSNANSRDGGKGDNVGLMAVVTLDENEMPVYLNLVHTCACFHAILPTTFLPPAAYPEEWDAEEFLVYGEKLPGLAKYPKDFDAGIRPVLFLRDGSHRVADVQVASIESVREQYELMDAPLAPMEALKHLPLGDGETSFYYEEGKKKGLVKGAYKRKEGLLLGAWIGDARVGQDRIYGGADALPKGFYTTINPRKKDESDMWDYAAFLRQNGWKP